MKVGLVADQYYLQSGVGVYTRNLIRWLLKIMPETDLCVIFSGLSGANRLARDLPCQVVGLPRRGVVWPAWQVLARPTIERWTGRLDILHVLSQSVWTPTEAKLVVTVHDLGFIKTPTHYPARRRWLKATALRRSVAAGAVFCCPSAATRDDLERRLGLTSGETVYIPSGCDHLPREQCPETTVAELRRKYGLPAEFFLHVGVVTGRKNVGNLVRAFDEFSARMNREVHLVFTGSIPDSIRDHARQEIDRSAFRANLRFLGGVPEKDLSGLYMTALGLVFPSWLEGFGFPVLEAMRCGLPVICSDTGSLPEVSGGAAHLVNPSSVFDLREAMLSVAGNRDLRNKLRRLGFERASLYKWAETSKAMLEVYQRVLSGSRDFGSLR